MDKYKISILMGIYNCESTLKDSIESIIQQTYGNWELIMCDDGSMDNTYEVAQKYVEQFPNKMILLRNEHNKGLNFTLNHCLKFATGELIARQDGDDLSEPKRFEKELQFLVQNPEYQIVSSAMSHFDEDGIWMVSKVKEKPLPEDLVKGSPICHAPVMMWKKCMDDVGGYSVDKRLLRVEDVNLWLKLYEKGYRCYNLSEALYGMRNDKNAFSRRKYKYRINSTYARLVGAKKLGLPWKVKIFAFSPMVVGLVPARLRKFIRKLKNSNE